MSIRLNNLFSMNTAIEAAHAGYACKGFAAAIAEIRRSAESSSEQSETIGTVLKKIKESIDRITVSTANVLEESGAVDSSVKTAAEQEESIRSATEEQDEGSKQILENISSASEIAKGSNEINVAVNHVNEISGQNRYGIGI